MPRPWSRSPVATGVFVMRSAGSSPSMSPTTSVRTKTKSSTRPSSVAGRTIGIDEQADQRLPQREGQPEAADAAGDRQAQALGQELAHQAAASGAERQAHRHLAHARRGARQQQVAEVRAGDEQDEPGAAEQHPQRVGEVTQRVRAARRRPRAQALVEEALPRRGIGQRPVVARQPLLEGHVGFGGRGVRRGARAQPAEHVQPHHLLDGAGHVVQPRPSGQDGRQVRQRQPGVGPLPHRLAEEPRRRHADHLERALAQRDGAADHVGAPAEAPLPQLVADHRLRHAAFRRLRRAVERAADQRRHAQRVEVRRRHQAERHFLGLGAVEARLHPMQAAARAPSPTTAACCSAAGRGTPGRS